MNSKTPEAFENDKIGLKRWRRITNIISMNEKADVLSGWNQLASRQGRQSFNLLSANTLSKTSSDIPFKQSFQTASRAFRVMIPGARCDCSV